MARLCAGVMAFVLLFRANRLLVWPGATGTRQHYPLLWFRPGTTHQSPIWPPVDVNGFARHHPAGPKEFKALHRSCLTHKETVIQFAAVRSLAIPLPPGHTGWGGVAVRQIIWPGPIFHPVGKTLVATALRCSGFQAAAD